MCVCTGVSALAQGEVAGWGRPAEHANGGRAQLFLLQKDAPGLDTHFFEYSHTSAAPIWWDMMMRQEADNGKEKVIKS